ncbi:MAG TPA: response regulator, partial [Kofleriaceae bacterium]|nr:response regulator [Kofleriaceae bacterium]
MNRRVLLIDADPEFQGTLTAELGRYRITVVAEPDPDAGVQLAAADPPAMIVIGVEEPEKAGFRVFQKCKKGALAKVPIALVTASVSPESFAKHRGLKV